MQRPGGVVAIAVVQLAGSALMLALAGLVAALAAVVKPSALAAPPGAPAPGPGAVLVAAGFFFLMAGWGIVTAVGLLRLQVWALVSTLLFALLLLGGGGFAAASVAILAVPGASAAALAVARGLAVGMGLGVVGLGIWWIAYLVRRRTRAAFYEAHPGPGRRQPLSMLVLAWLLIGGSVTSLVSLPFADAAARAPVVLAGFTLHGALGHWVYPAFGVIDVVIGIGLLGLRRWAWIAAIVWFILGALNMVATWLTPAALRQMRQAVQTGPAAPEIASALTSTWFLGLIAVFSVAVVVVALYFLWSRRGAFQPLPG